MHSQIKQSWIQALRSNDFIQSYGALRTPHGHCALGVLMELIAAHPEWPGHEEYPRFGFNHPRKALDKIGVSAQQADLIAMLNDRGTPFPEIADVIEKDLESEYELAASVHQKLTQLAREPRKDLHMFWLSSPQEAPFPQVLLKLAANHAIASWWHQQKMPAPAVSFVSSMLSEPIHDEIA